MTSPGNVTFDAVEFELSHGVSCFAEYAMTSSPSCSLCIVLHDEGEDLVSLRWLSLRLLAEGISQLLVDLPGHGLSGGNTRDHLKAALDAAHAFAGSIGCTTVSFLAKGSTCRSMLLAEQSCPPVAAVLMSPVGPAPDAIQHASWQHVPKLAFLPRDHPASTAFADAVVRDTHAWCLRASLAFDPGRTALSAAAETQIGSITAKFLLEQIAFAQGAQASRPSPREQPVQATPGGPVQP